MVTHPPKSDRDMSRSHAVFTACNSSIPEHLQGTSTPSSGDQLCQGPCIPKQSLTVPTIRTFDQLWWVLHCLSVLPGEKGEGKKLQVNLPQKQYTIQQCQPTLDDAPCKASVKRARITKSTLVLISMRLLTKSEYGVFLVFFGIWVWYFSKGYQCIS